MNQPCPVPNTSTEAITTESWEGEASEWDQFVASDPQGTFCHLAGWRDVIGDVLRHEFKCLIARDRQGGWTGILPLVRVRSPLLGHYLISMPFLNYGGPLGTPGAQVGLADAAVAEARRCRADLLELRARHPAPVNLRGSHRKLTVILELPSSVDALWEDTFDHKLRNKIRRAQREVMEPRFGPSELNPFYGIFARRMHQLGTPVLPRQFFSRLVRVFPDKVLFGAVYWRGQPLAAGCGFLWRDEFEMTWSAQLVTHKDKSPNLILYWSFMQHLVLRGVRRFNFGRSTAGSGPHEFKRQWGGADVLLPWLQWSPSGVVSPPSPERPLYRAASLVWSRLPVAVTRRVGPALARLLP